MSNKDNQSSDKTVQYASTAPSLSSLLNLPQVSMKRRPAMGLAPQTKTAAGSATTKMAKLELKTGLKPSATSGLKPSATSGLKPSESFAAKAAATAAVTSQIPDKNTKLESNAVRMSAVTSSSMAVSAPQTDKEIAVIVSHGQTVKKPPTGKTTQPANTASTVDPEWNPAHWRLFVGNLGPEVTDQTFLSAFHPKYPSVSRAVLARDRKSQKSRGFGFVAFADGREYLRALREMQGHWIGNRQCQIKKSDHQPTLK